jgi:hypothetical protein
MKPEGFIAWASHWPLFENRGLRRQEHPILVIKCYPDVGTNGVLGITHSADLFDINGSCCMDRRVSPSALSPIGPLTDAMSVLGVMAGGLSLEVVCTFQGDVIIDAGEPITTRNPTVLSNHDFANVKLLIGVCAREWKPRPRDRR